jgi:hypothetical protein
MLHIYNDGSILRLITSRDLVAIPTWKGQRILDREHAAIIKVAVGTHIQSLDSGFCVVKYNEENADGRIEMSSYLIDGQHRASIIRDFYATTLCEPDFNVTVREKTVESEAEAIEYFNAINNVKAQQWKVDPNLLVNNYIVALENAINIDKKCLLIRPDMTRRPYLCSANLREALLSNKGLLCSNPDAVARFVENVEKYNSSTITNFELETAHGNTKNAEMKVKAIGLNFALAYDAKLRWVYDCLR